MSLARYRTIYISNNDVTFKLKAFYDAVYNNNLKTADELARQHPEFVNTIVKPIYDCALSRTILRGSISYSMLALLLKHHIDMNIFVTIDKMTALDFACKNRNFDLCSFLLTNKVTISSLTPHYLLSLTTDVKYLTLENIKNLYQIIKLLGGLEYIEKMNNGNNQSFKDCAIKTRLQNKFGGSMKYDLWNLLKLAQQVELQEAEYEEKPSNSAKRELEATLKIIVTAFSKKTKVDKLELGGSFLFFSVGSEVIPEYVVPTLAFGDDEKHKKGAFLVSQIGNV